MVECYTFRCEYYSRPRDVASLVVSRRYDRGHALLQTAPGPRLHGSGLDHHWTDEFSRGAEGWPTHLFADSSGDSSAIAFPALPSEAQAGPFEHPDLSDLERRGVSAPDGRRVTRG